jgi:nitric oxide reductase activation protein
MSRIMCQEKAPVSDHLPVELVELKERVLAQPAEIRAELEPLVDDALEDAHFRRQAMLLARDALERFRHDLTLVKFDLEATRREREALRAMVDLD